MEKNKLLINTRASSDGTAQAAEGEAFQKRKILFFSDFNPHTARELIAKLFYLDKKSSKDIYLYINSPGGYVTDFLAIYDVIQGLNSRVVTVATGQAASCGAFLLTTGAPKCRVAYKNARIMFHQPSGGFYGTETESKIHVAELTRLKELTMELMIKHNPKKMNRKKALEILNKDTFLSADEAKKLGLLDVVHNPSEMNRYIMPYKDLEVKRAYNKQY